MLSDLVVDAVGYAAGDHTPANYRVMKAVALAHCLDGRRFVQVRSGSTMVNAEDPAFLAWVFPHLDPFGIGGFRTDLRSERGSIGFARQLRNVLLQDNSRFARDPTFAYVCWNFMQRKELNRSLVFRISPEERFRLGQTLYEVAPALTDLMRLWQTDPWAKPKTELQKRALAILTRLQHVSRHLRGTTGYKQARRNELRGLLRAFGTPALFLTLNPADLYNPLVGLHGGIEVREWQSMPLRDRAAFVASNPAAAAHAFDELVRCFLEVVVIGKQRGKGLFGECEAFYGMVEAQGRGTLHVHMLLWLKGSPSPQLLRDRMHADETYKSNVVEWLEETIKCELPDQTSLETRSNLSRPEVGDGDFDPRIVLQPRVDEMSAEEFSLQFKKLVKELAVTCNWHEHTDTCWKHLRKGEPRDDAHCRMRIDGSTREKTAIDPETLSVLLRRLHPRINNYNEVLLFLLQCNMDIKFISSGPAAKALVFYITDYITKSSLSVHAGLDAIRYAIQRNAFDNQAGGDDAQVKEKKLFVKSVNALMGRQELSHQQVMGYLIGGGDHYRSHAFVTLCWDMLDRYIRRLEDGPGAPNPSICVTVDSNGLHPADVLQDYVCRSEDEAFTSMSIWQYVQLAEKIPLAREAVRTDRVEERLQAHVSESRYVPRGRPANARGRFIDSHPQYNTHLVRIRSEPYVVVLSGRRIPRPCDEAMEDMYEEWCRAVLILFTPWRSLRDLKREGESWSCRFARTTFDSETARVIRNMNVEKECEDAREIHRTSGEKLPDSWVDVEGGDAQEDVLEALEMSLEADAWNSVGLDDGGDIDLATELFAHEQATTDIEVIRTLDRANLFCNTLVVDVDSGQPLAENMVCLADEADLHLIDNQSNRMKSLKKRKRSASPNPVEDDGAEPPCKRVAYGAEGVSIASLRSSDIRSSSADGLSIVDAVASIQGLSDNEEQDMALRIVCEHYLLDDDSQLLLHISGIGGSGKSHVINAIREVFRRLGCGDKLVVAAPTGCAAVLIGGNTIHSLTLLPRRRGNVNQTELEEIWRGVSYLIIDEISLVPAKLLSDISHRLSLAKSADSVAAARPFGGINVIFTGDFGQLKPVADLPLFSYKLVQRLTPDVEETIAGQTALHGAYLWRGLTHVVELKKNFRAMDDPAYINLLNRVRMGVAWDGSSPMTDIQRGCGINYATPDYETLSRRKIDYVLTHSPDELERFRDAPVLVARKSIRDAVNHRKSFAFAEAHGVEIHLYRSQDMLKKMSVPLHLQKLIWKISSSTTEDALGCLPLCIGLPVMVTENLSLSHAVVNGAQGTVCKITYSTDANGYRVATCVYVHIPGCQVGIVDDQPDVVPIVPTSSTFKYVDPQGTSYGIRRTQVPLVPAFAFTDYKVQGRSLSAAVVDLAGCRSLQSVYVMLSRAKSLQGLLVLRWFPSHKVYQPLSQEFRNEFKRLHNLAGQTANDFIASRSLAPQPS